MAGLFFIKVFTGDERCGVT